MNAKDLGSQPVAPTLESVGLTKAELVLLVMAAAWRVGNVKSDWIELLGNARQDARAILEEYANL